MPFRIAYMPVAVGHLRHLTADERSRVLDGVDEQLLHQPDVRTRNRKPMGANALAEWELRIGDLRVFYDVERQPDTVVILAVGTKRGNRLWVGGEEIAL